MSRSRLLLGLLVALLCVPGAAAQHLPAGVPALFAPAPAARQSLSAADQEQLATLERAPTTAAVQFVHLPGDLVRQRLLSFYYTEANQLATSANGAPGIELFIRRDDVRVVSDDEYTWVGSIRAVERPDHVVGDALLVIRQGEGVAGTLTIDGEQFQIHPLQRGLHALVEINERGYPTYSGPDVIGTAGSSHGVDVGSGEDCDVRDEDGHAETGASSAAPRCSLDRARVLVVYTARAAQGRNISSIASLAVQETNDAYNRSQVNNYDLVTARLQQVSFSETLGGTNGSTRISTDLSRLQSNSQINTLRDQYSADVVILLTDGNYTTPFGEIAGVAAAIRATASTAYAIVEVDYATGGYTFGHEIGHLQGAQHHPDDPVDLSQGFSYGFGHRFSDRDCTLWIFCDTDYYSTMMAYTPGEYDRIRNFSNPSVTYDSKATGIANQRDNARVLRTTADAVSDFRDPNELRAAFNGSGDPFTGAYTFTASPCGGNGTISYEWRISYGTPNNFGGVISTSSSFSRTLAPGDNYVKLTVRSSTGQVSSSTRLFYVFEDNCDGFFCEPCLTPTGIPTPCEPLRMDEATAEVEAALLATMPTTPVLEGAYPNPFNPSTAIGFSMPEAGVATLVVYDVAGREVARLVDGPVNAGAHTATFDAARLPSGTYLVRLQTGATVQTTPITLVK